MFFENQIMSSKMTNFLLLSSPPRISVVEFRLAVCLLFILNNVHRCLEEVSELFFPHFKNKPANYNIHTVCLFSTCEKQMKHGQQPLST